MVKKKLVKKKSVKLIVVETSPILKNATHDYFIGSNLVSKPAYDQAMKWLTEGISQGLKEGRSSGLSDGILWSHVFWIVVLIGAAAIWGH